MKKEFLRTLAVLTLVLALCAAIAALSTGCSVADATEAAPAMEAPVGSQEEELKVYYTGYNSGDENLLITTHAKYGVTCAQCHDQSNLDKWTAAEKDAEGFVVDEDYEFGRYSCLACHDDGNPLTGKELAEFKDSVILEGTVTTYNKQGLYNVHSNHRSEQNCTDCHTMHGESVVSCTFCHELDAIPEGWHITFDYCG